LSEDDVIWEMVPHTGAKHAILDYYLKAWLPILANSGNSRLVYIDGFAGPGIYKGGEPGSPIIALKIARDHRIKLESEIIFYFIEADKERSDNLEKEIGKIAKTLPENFKIGNICNKFAVEMKEVLDQLDKTGNTLAPSFVFIDPFGFSSFPLSIITRIMKNKKCEILITFMHSFIDRFDSRPEIEPILNETFGTTDWKTIDRIKDDEKRKDLFRDLYMKQLREEAGIKYVHSFEMRDTSDKPIYCLVFGTNHERGLEVMKEAFWKIDATGNFRFADKTISGQTILFGADLSPLRTYLITKHKGERLPWKQLWNIVNIDTPYLTTHLRKILIKMEYEVDPPEISVEATDRRAKTYPEDRAIITII